MRGVALFRKHIPGWDKHNRYHRIGEQKELLDAIRSRYRRERGDAPTGKIGSAPNLKQDSEP
jgi:hypothetical protein